MLKCGTLITFDNLPTPLANTTTYASIPTNYEGLSWSGFFISNATPKSGYEAGIISLPNVAYNSDGGVATIQSLRAGKTFNLISAHMAAAWSDGLQVDIAGYLGSTKIYDNKYTLSATESKFINFNYQGVDKIVFSSSGGTPHQAYGDTGQSYKNFLMDNVLVGF